MDDTEEMENSHESESFDDIDEAESVEDEEEESEEWSVEGEASGFMEIFHDMADSEDSDADTDWGIDFGSAVGFIKPIVKVFDDMLYIGSKAMVTAVRFGYRMAKDKLRESTRQKEYVEPEEEPEEEEEDPFSNDSGN